MASAGGHEKVVQILLEHNADINAQSTHRGSALQVASVGGHEKVVQMLLDHDADVNADGGYHGNALQATSAVGYDRIVQMLLDHNADVNAQGGRWGNALHAASARGDGKIIKMLLDMGARCTTKVLFHLFANKYITLLPALSSHIQMEMMDERDALRNKTLLHYAAECGLQTVTKRCLDLGADIDATDKVCKTALHYAAKNGHLEVVKTLVEAKANRKIRDGRGRTALDCAQKSYQGDSRVQPDIVAYLQGQGRTISSIYSSTISSFRKAR